MHFGFIFIVFVSFTVHAWCGQSFVPLTNIQKINLPVAEVTPIYFQKKLYLLENWLDPATELPASLRASLGAEPLVPGAWIRDFSNRQVIAKVSRDLVFATAILEGERVLVYGGDAKRDWKSLSLSFSSNMRTWSEPVPVLTAPPGTFFFNTAVTRKKKDWYLLAELGRVNQPSGFKPSFYFFHSRDGRSWSQISNAVYGGGNDKYVGGPSLYFSKGFFYVLYLSLEGSSNPSVYHTRITRSKDLRLWQDAPFDRPFLAYATGEGAASDAELVSFDGKTHIFYSGGFQYSMGTNSRLRVAIYPGSPDVLFKSFFSTSENFNVFAIRTGWTTFKHNLFHELRIHRIHLKNTFKRIFNP